MQTKRYSSDLSARQWQRLAPLLVVRRTSKWPLQAVVNGIFYVLSHTRIKDVTDGTSHTLLGAEIVLSADIGAHDGRGRYWNTWDGNNFFSTRYPPNTSAPDLSLLCVSIPTAPCTSSGWPPSGSLVVQSARSNHTGGANFLLADGAVRFIDDEVDAALYKALGTRAGQETPLEF